MFYMAVQDQVTDIEMLKRDYLCFLKFIEENICEYYKVSELIDQLLFFKVMQTSIEQLKTRLQKAF